MLLNSVTDAGCVRVDMCVFPPARPVRVDSQHTMHAYFRISNDMLYRDDAGRYWFVAYTEDHRKILIPVFIEGRK